MATPELTLYQFPISHYCEKVRWALDYKAIPYTTVNLVPGKHVFAVKRMGLPTTSVPIIRHDKALIQGSSKIFDYLDNIFPTPTLTPKASDEKKQALDIEEFADKEIGPHLRRFFYFHILQNKELACQILAGHVSDSEKKKFKRLFFLIKFFMKSGMKMNVATADKSMMRLTHAMDKLSAHIKNKTFFVGNTLSRADIAVASLLAPLVAPPQHAFPWPNEKLMPALLVKFKNRHTNDRIFQWVLKTYETSRFPK